MSNAQVQKFVDLECTFVPGVSHGVLFPPLLCLVCFFSFLCVPHFQQ